MLKQEVLKLNNNITTANENESEKTNFIQICYERIKNSKSKYLLLTFFLPLFLLWLAFITMEVYPFGNNSVLVLDLNGQYVSFFEYLRRLIYEGGGILYSWERALGGEFMGIFAYYIASPFSLLVALFPKSMITEALLCIILLKCGSCGLAMGFYLHKTHPTRPANIVIFSTLYALTSYAVVYGHNTMWIDQLIILPVLTYAIEQLITKRKYKLFTISLALSLIVNFYIGFMMCIYTFFYFFYYIFLRNNIEKEKLRFLRSLVQIGFFALIALAIASVVLLPTYYSLTFGKTTFTTPAYAFDQRFDFLDIFLKLFPGSYDTVRPEGLPWIYCGTLSLILLPVFFFSPNKNITGKEKIFAGIVLIFFIISFNSSTLDLIWHGFQKPNWLNNRYSFMLCFFIILYAYKAFEQIEKIDFRWVVTVCGVLVVILMIIQKQHYSFVNDLKFIWVSIGCLGAMLIGLYLVNKQVLKGFSAYILLILVCLEMFSATLLNLTSLDSDVVFTSRTNYVTYMGRVSPIINRITASDDSFYRMEKALYRKTNDPMAFGFRGLSNSTSTLNASVINLLNQLGLSAKSHWSKYIGGNPVVDSLLGLKYIVYPDEPHNELLYEPYMDDEPNTLYAQQNPYALSIAYAVNEAVLETDINEFDEAFLMLNRLVGNMLGVDNIDLFKYIRPTDTDYDNIDIAYVTGHKKYSPARDNREGRIVSRFIVPTADEIFMFVPTTYPRELRINISGEPGGYILGNDTDCIVSLGIFEPGEEIYVSLTILEECVYIANGGSFFYYLDTQLFKDTMPRLIEGSMNIEEFSNTRLYGTVNIPAGRELLFTTIPYDEGWQVKIDGETVPLLKTLDSLLAVNITEGDHTVEFLYRPKPFLLGLTLCAGASCIFALIVAAELWFTHKKQKSNKKLIDVQMIV